MTEKKQIGFYLETSLIDEFRRFVAEQYGKITHGILSFEVGQALQSWIASHKNAQTGLTNKRVNANPIPNVYNVKEEVKEYLISQFAYEKVYKVPKQHLIIAIGAIRGTDHRTVKKWIKLFEQYGVIKWLNASIVEFI